MIQSVYSQLATEKLPYSVLVQRVSILLDTVSTLRAYLIKAPTGKKAAIKALIGIYESMVEDKKSEIEKENLQ